MNVTRLWKRLEKTTQPITHAVSTETIWYAELESEQGIYCRIENGQPAPLAEWEQRYLAPGKLVKKAIPAGKEMESPTHLPETLEVFAQAEYEAAGVERTRGPWVWDPPARAIE